MSKKQTKNTLITIILVIVLSIILGVTAQNVWRYYSGPDYIVNTYLKSLKEKDYDRLFVLLDQESLKEIGGKDEIIEYYKRTYEQKNKLVNVEASKGVGQVYTVKYLLSKGLEKGTLSVVQKAGKWYITLPFKASDIEVFAPYGAKVYLESKEMKYSDHKTYQMENVLPGTYLLKVDPAQEAYEPYYKMLEIPSEKSYIVPYDLAHVTVDVVPQLEVQISPFSQRSEQSKVEFEDLIVGKYQIKVQDTEGYLKKQETEIDIKKGQNHFIFKDFELSQKGEQKLEGFAKEFYKDYLEGIKIHSSEKIETYFSPSNRAEQLSLYSSWYIDKKKVKEATISVKLGEHFIDEQGMLHVEMTENVELQHEAYDEVKQVSINETYKVMLKWDTTVSILDKEWEIIDREMKESMVAVKDQEGHWIQY